MADPPDLEEVIGVPFPVGPPFPMAFKETLSLTSILEHPVPVPPPVATRHSVAQPRSDPHLVGVLPRPSAHLPPSLARPRRAKSTGHCAQPRSKSSLVDRLGRGRPAARLYQSRVEDCLARRDRRSHLGRKSGSLLSPAGRSLAGQPLITCLQGLIVALGTVFAGLGAWGGVV